jgi:hypothetical protein
VSQDPTKEEIDAIERLARSPDGPFIRRYFRRVLESCRLTDDAGALQRHEGARILARDFLVHMDRGLETPLDRTSDTILRSPSPVARAGSLTERRRAIWAADSEFTSVERVSKT